MGEAVYYMKVTFEKREWAEEVLPQLIELFREGYQACEWWQNNRRMTKEKFWPQFEEKFPQISEYLKRVRKQDLYSDDKDVKPLFGGDCNNALAGNLDFAGGADDPDEWSLHPDRAVMTYSSEVWHLADWEPIAEFIRRKFNPVRVTWISDEDVSPFELLD